MVDPIKIQTTHIPASVFIEAQQQFVPTVLSLLQGKELISPQERAEINSAITRSYSSNLLLHSFMKHAGIPNLDNMGTLRVIRAGDPTYALAEEALKADNAAEIIRARNESREPLLLTMPAIILESEHLMNASYTGALDMMIVGKRFQTRMGPDGIKVVMAHELGHKRSMLVNGRNFAIPVNLLESIKQITPELFSACQKAGLSDEQTAQLLASSLLARRSGIKESSTEPQPLQNAGDTACHEAVARTTIADIKAIIESNPDIQMQLRKANMVLSRAEELRADDYAKDAFGARAAAFAHVASALVRGTPIDDKPHDELATHPTAAERLKHIGCTALKPETFVDADGITKNKLKVECSTEPTELDSPSLTIPVPKPAQAPSGIF